MKTPHFLTEVDRKWCFPDQIKIHLYCGLGSNGDYSSLKWGLEGNPLQAEDGLPGFPKASLFLTKSIGINALSGKPETKCRLTTTLNLNWNREAVSWLKKQLDMELPHFRYAYKDNFIPLEFRAEMERQGVTTKKLRKAVSRRFWRKLRQFKKAIQGHIRGSYKVPKNWELYLKTSLGLIELSQDVRGAPGEELFKHQGVRNAIRRATEKYEEGEIDDKGRIRLPEGRPRASEAGGGRYRRAIIGILPNGMKFRIYLKADGGLGALTRFELVAHKKKLRRKLLDDTVEFSSQADLDDRISRMLKVSFDELLSIFSVERSYDIRGRRKLLREWCRIKFQKNYWEPAFDQLIEYGCITTGSKTTATYPAIARRALEIARSDTPFLRKAAAARYEPDWVWILSNKVTDR